MFEILGVLEAMRLLKLPWIPLSMHHDGCALLVKEETFEPDRVKLEQEAFARLEPSGMVPFGLEFTPYEATSEASSDFEDNLSDNRAPM